MSTTVIDKSARRVQRMFGEIAPHYDRMNHLLSLNIDRYWRWWTVRKLNPKPNEPILDVCTGTGDLAIAFRSCLRRPISSICGQKSVPTISDFPPVAR